MLCRLASPMAASECFSCCIALPLVHGASRPRRNPSLDVAFAWRSSRATVAGLAPPPQRKVSGIWQEELSAASLWLRPNFLDDFVGIGGDAQEQPNMSRVEPRRVDASALHGLSDGHCEASPMQKLRQHSRTFSVMARASGCLHRSLGTPVSIRRRLHRRP